MKLINYSTIIIDVYYILYGNDISPKVDCYLIIFYVDVCYVMNCVVFYYVFV